VSEETTIVQRPRNYSDIAHLSDPDTFEQFLTEPLTFIAETVTGFLGEGKKGFMVSGGRLAQAVFKGRVYQQFAWEVKNAREKGRISEDFADKKYGFTTWVELMSILDEEVPDEDRLEALKALFFSVNAPTKTDQEKIVEYQSWQVAKHLQSGELYLMNAIYRNRDSLSKAANAPTWVSMIAEVTGLGTTGLIDLYERNLIEKHVLSPRYASGTIAAQGATILPGNGRLTDLGMRICHSIETYRIAKSEED